MSKIKLTYDDKEYELEYSRQSVKIMEGRGFNFEAISSMPMTMIPLLFEGAFIKNCTGVKRKTMDEIYDGIGDKTGLIQALAEMYAETLSALTDNSDEGNVTWAVTR